jgi:acyl-CoA-binding protein
MATSFEDAVDQVNNKMNKSLTNEELLEIYSLYKQATVGEVSSNFLASSLFPLNS